MKTIFLLFVTSMALSCFAQTPSFDWAYGFGSNFGGQEQGNSIVTDQFNNSYITGSFNGVVDFDPGPGTASLNSSNASDAFIIKLDENGNLLWAKNIGGDNIYSGTVGYSITVDLNGFVYVTGSFGNSVDFDPGPGTQIITSNGGFNTFVLKLDTNGDFIWAKAVGSGFIEAGLIYDVGKSIKTNSNGDVYVSGNFGGTVDFDPGTGVYNLSSNGYGDIFILKLDTNGSFIYAKAFGSNLNDLGNSIDLDALGNIYCTGWFVNTVDFDPGAGINSVTSNGGADVFILKLAPNGNFVWVKKFGSAGDHDMGTTIHIDNNGNIYTTGHFRASCDFNPGAGNYTLSSNGGPDIFVQKLNSSGVFVWARKIGGTSSDQGNDLSTDSNGNVYITGYFTGTVDFDPGPGNFSLMSSSNYTDQFIQKLDANGNFLWAGQNGSNSQNDEGLGIAIDENDAIYSTGYFWYTADFDPSISNYFLNSNGYTDIFVQKLIPCNYNPGIDIVNSCGPYQWIDGNYYFVSNNTAIHALTSLPGCDSVVQLNLSISYPSFSTDVINSCYPITWIDGNNYAASNNTATHVLTNMSGCDSTITLDLTINTDAVIDYHNECSSLTWIDGNTYTTSNNSATHTLTNNFGCDSIVTLNLSINSNSSIDTQTSCVPFTWIDGNEYSTNNNTATYTLTNTAGCDSIITLDLTINNVDAGTSVNGITISSNTVNGQYQWLDCDNNYEVLLGETAQSFTPDYNSSFAVEVFENGCTDTSACVLITTVGIGENEEMSQINIFPNPATDIINISCEEEIQSITLLDITGKTIKTIHNESKLKVGDVSPGIYWIKVKLETRILNDVKIIIQ